MTRRRGEQGQATTEVALLIPIFIAFLIAFAKVFALLILVQKLQIGSFYAARRWQLQSHRNSSYETVDNTTLLPGISNQVCTYVGYGPNCSVPTPNFLDLGPCTSDVLELPQLERARHQHPAHAGVERRHHDRVHGAAEPGLLPDVGLHLLRHQIRSQPRPPDRVRAPGPEPVSAAAIGEQKGMIGI